ncbi:MAG: hypothetical protein EOL88_05050 [Bacteroidia bacterium]|nr:hypothetical protein [Bacteroidia bacterium]
MTAVVRMGWKRFKQWFNPFRQRQLSVFLTCAGISAVLWLLIRLSENVSSTIDYPVVVTDIPQGFALTDVSDSVLHVRIDSRGWYLLGLQRLVQNPKVAVSLSNVRLQERNNQFFSSIPTRGIKERIAHSLEMHNQLISLTPDTLYFRLDPLVHKLVPVLPVIDFVPDHQFYLYAEISAYPGQIEISGLTEDVNAIDTLFSESWSGTSVRGPLEIFLQVVKPQSRFPLTLSSDSVRVVIPLEQYTESVVTIPIEIVNELNAKKMRIFPDEVEISYLVALKDYASIAADDFHARVVFRGESTSRLPVELLFAPKKCRIQSISPANVEYIFMK